ncbi:MAG: uroporphyrinogen-III synthase [Thermoplasmatales archaeon]
MEGNVAYVGASLEIAPPGVVAIPVLKIVYRDLSGLRRINTPIALASKRSVISLKMSRVAIDTKSAYCIGSETSQYLRTLYSLDCLVPESQNSEGLARMIVSKERKVTVVGSNRTSKQLLSNLKNGGVEVIFIPAYYIEENENVEYHDIEKVKKILVGSSFSFEILNRRAKDLIKGKKIYAIGKPTYVTMVNLSFNPEGYFVRPSIYEILDILLNDSEKDSLLRDP